MNNLPKKYYLDPRHKYVKFQPEKNIEVLPYSAELWKKRFPAGVDLTKLKLTNIGEYSIATPKISEALITFIKSQIEYSPDLVVTEMNGGVGGFTIKLAEHFNTINVVEINPIHAKIIENNLAVYGFADDEKKINIHTADYLDVMDNFESDIIISDPPWGGRSYGKKSAITLGLNNVDISYIINHLYAGKKFKLFILLCPYNFDTNRFLDNIKVPEVCIHKMDKHRFIAIKGPE